MCASCACPDAKPGERLELVPGASELEAHSLMDGRRLARHERGRPARVLPDPIENSVSLAHVFSAPRTLMWSVGHLTATRRRPSSSATVIRTQKPVVSDSATPVRHPVLMDEGEPRLTLDEAYRATYHFISQYYARERITPFMLMLHSMGLEADRQTNDPATWDDWMASVEKARASPELPVPDPPLDDR